MVWWANDITSETRGTEIIRNSSMKFIYRSWGKSFIEHTDNCNAIKSSLNIHYRYGYDNYINIPVNLVTSKWSSFQEIINNKPSYLWLVPTSFNWSPPPVDRSVPQAYWLWSLGVQLYRTSHHLDTMMTCFMTKVQNLNGNDAKNTSNTINSHQGSNICCTLIHLTHHAN